MTDSLRLLWLTSWTLAATSLSVMGFLIAARLWRDGVDSRRRRARAAITQAYLAVMAGAPQALTRLGQDRANPSLQAEALLEMLGVVRGADRDRLVEALRAWGLDQRLLPHLNRGPIQNRLTTAEALGVFPGPQNEAALRAVLSQAAPALRLAAAKSLLQLGAPIDVGAFLRQAEGRGHPRSASLAEVLRPLAERQPADCATLLLGRDLPDPLRVMLAEALGASSDYGVLPVLEQAAISETPAVRAAALRTLGRLMHPAAEAAVAQGMTDADSQVRAAAAAAAGAAGLANLTPQLAHRLRDPVWTVRFHAAEALARLGARGIALLRAEASGENGEAARIAALTLAERRL